MRGIAVLPQGLEKEGSAELATLGAEEVSPLKRCASFQADMACLYRLHLHARLPFRLLREIGTFPCNSPNSLYKGIQKCFQWSDWLTPNMSFRVDVSGSQIKLNHSHYTALQVKNAIVDIQRELWGQRSSIDVKEPDLCLHLHLSNNHATLSLDGTHTSLHRRGYKAAIGKAPLKENLAAGLIRLSGWENHQNLVDPLCGSGTFLLEAASQSLDLAPGLNKDFTLKKWFDFNKFLWEKEKQIAINNEKWGKKMPKIIGTEQDKIVFQNAQINIKSAGLDKNIVIRKCHFSDLKLPSPPGVIVCNPPYGKRVGREENLVDLYEELGNFLKENGSGWDFWILSGNPSLTKALRMKCRRKIPINNGGIECRWLNYSIF